MQFPVLLKYKKNTWCDKNGCILYTKNRGIPEGGFESTKWKEVEYMTTCGVGRTIVYDALFAKCDREEDDERAWGDRSPA